jgi:hypothetical protein
MLSSELAENSPSSSLATPERRLTQRYSIKQRCLVRPAGSGGARPDDWKGIAYDISSHGIGLTVALPLQPGAELVIEPWDLPGAATVQVRIVRTVPVEFTWFLGCELLRPLDEPQLRLWLRDRIQN